MAFLVIKADARHLPVHSCSADMMLATPPFIGASDAPVWRSTRSSYRKRDCCTDDPAEYRAWIGQFMGEAERILKPHGYLLMSGERPPNPTHVGKRYVQFKVLRKEPDGDGWRFRKIRNETFWTRFMQVRSIWWAVRPHVYRELILKYSQTGDVVVHVFSGSGNSGIAALGAGRLPVLIDLHYHRDARRRLANSLKFNKATRLQTR